MLPPEVAVALVNATGQTAATLHFPAVSTPLQVAVCLQMQYADARLVCAKPRGYLRIQCLHMLHQLPLSLEYAILDLSLMT